MFGAPSPSEPWGWQIDGHHLIVNCFVLGDQIVMTPNFMGSEPVYAESGKYAGTRVFADEESGGAAVMRSLTPEQRVYARAGMTGDGTLSGVIGAIDATILIGLSTAGGAFTEAVVREMARKVERPILLPLSNPTERSEATAAELIHWTGGRALAATGSPFPPVHYNGRSITVAQCNNVYIFPAMGLGAVAAQARRITDSMFLAAARALAACSPALQDPSAPLLPALEDLRRVSLQIAFAAGCEAQRTGHAPRQPAESLMRSIAAAQWTPAYPEF